MPDPSTTETWRRALTGDRDAFEDALAPYMDTLRQAAERQLAVERDVVSNEPLDGETVVDLTPEELVGETLVRAWELKDRFDADRMGLRAWLLGLQTRSLARFARRESRYMTRKAISLDEELPTSGRNDAVEEQFYEFRQPFDVDTYEEIIVNTAPSDPEIDDYDDANLSKEDRAALADVAFRAETRQAAILHDEFGVDLSEVAQILDASLKDTAKFMNLARAGLRARLGSSDDSRDDDPTVDSYTGDPLPDA